MIMRRTILWLFTAIAASAAPVHAVLALSSADYSRNDIIFYDKDATPPADCPPPNATTTSGADVPAAGSTAESIYKFLVQQGLTPIQAAGVIGNLMRETSGGTFDLKPEAVNPKSGAYGIVQWMGGRKTKLMARPNYNTIQVQANYMWEEFNSGYNSTVFQPLKATNDLYNATWIVLTRYEIPCMEKTGECVKGGYQSTSLEYAKKALAAFEGITIDQLGISSSTTQCQAPTTPGTTSTGGEFAWPTTKETWGPMGAVGCSFHYSDGSWHSGIDIGLPVGTPLFAPVTGTVVTAETSGGKVTGYGMVTIKFSSASGKTYYYNYQHMNKITVSVGQQVKAGDPVGLSGDTMSKSYPHLHWSLWDTQIVSGHSYSPAVGTHIFHPFSLMTPDGRSLAGSKCQTPYVGPGGNVVSYSGSTLAYRTILITRSDEL